MYYYKVWFTLQNGIEGEVYLTLQKEEDIPTMLDSLFRSPVVSYSHSMLCRIAIIQNHH